MNTLLNPKFFLLPLLLLATSSLFAAWEEGQGVPDLAGYQLEGDLPELAGKVTYIDFWASWCAPCKASFPEMERIYQENTASGFQIVAISVDSTDKAMQRFLDRAKPSFVIVRDVTQKLVADAGIEVMPTSFLVDKNGVIRAVHYGWRGSESSKKLESEIAELLKEDG